MSYCINPDCQNRQNPDNLQECQDCKNELLIKGRYRLIKPLRTLRDSGYFEVFEVDDAGIPKVLKVLKTNHHQKYTELFEQEAKILTNLTHPGIPKAKPDEDFPYQLKNGPSLRCLVMEKIDGENLEQWLQQNQRISNDLALNWLRQITEILQFVHQNHFFHRDIKPSNIMLKADDGQLVLIDFGTARREVTKTVVERRDVTVVYSKGYTAQEQFDGRAVPQSDFFALGRTFVHLLTGQPPDSLKNDPKTKQLIWRHLASDISEPLANLIDKLMAPSVQDRPGDTQIILKQLKKIAPSLPPSPPSPLYRWGVIFGFPIILLVGVFIGWRIFGSPDRPVPTSQSCDSPALDVSEIAFSPEGKYLAQVSLDKTVRVFDATQPLNATSDIKQVDCNSHKDGVVALKFSPDGTKIATASLDGTAGLGNMNKNGKVSFKFLRHKTPVVALDFSKDGKYLATVSTDGMVKVWDTNNRNEITKIKFETYVRIVSFSPDGKYLATANLNNKAQVWEWQTHKKGEKAIPLPQNDVVAVAFHPTDSKYLATVSADGIAQVWDMTSRKAIANLPLKTYLMAVSFSPNGKHLVITSLKNKAWVWEWQKDSKTAIPLLQDDVVAVAFSPNDGKYLATASADGIVKVWTTNGGHFKTLRDRDSKSLMAVAFNPVDETQLAMASADGKVKIEKLKSANCCK